MDNTCVNVAVGGGGRVQSVFHNIASVANLLLAWKKFKAGKTKKSEVALFELRLEENLFVLHKSLMDRTYIHDKYEDFYICDPKRRHIHKASVRDRVLYQAIFQVLYPIFDKHFIYDSYSSRNNKGTHLGVRRLARACRKQTKNWRVKGYALKCDVSKFFDSIDHEVLRDLIKKKVQDPDFCWLLDQILESFSISHFTEKLLSQKIGKGLPLGNVTSQLFANIYLNEFDQFVKHKLRAKYYFRYCDDFVILHENVDHLVANLERIKVFMINQLGLELHPAKIQIRKISQGVDFLGYVVLPHVTVLRTKTGKRIMCKIDESNAASYLGVLSHCRGRKLRAHVRTFLRKLDADAVEYKSL